MIKYLKYYISPFTILAAFFVMIQGKYFPTYFLLGLSAFIILGDYLIKEDGSEVVLHLTEGNSPLPSNVINCIGIIPNTGEVFFGTTNGIASFRSDATEAKDIHDNTLVFPNPVHPEYELPITITGLPEDATVKIADVAGRVVYELVAVGGTAVWNGLNFDGQKPQTGVYLIFSANKDDEDSLVSKLLIVR